MPMYSGVQQHLVAEGTALCIAGFIICEGREINVGLCGLDFGNTHLEITWALLPTKQVAATVR